jgi:CubicO group peptidase (beta-lactamase class C family)
MRRLKTRRVTLGAMALALVFASILGERLLSRPVRADKAPPGLDASSVIALPKAGAPPVIDGRLDDRAWKTSQVFTDFRTMDPRPGLEPGEKTKVYLTYDAAAIYVALECFDSQPGKIRTGSAEVDNIVFDDWAAFCLDSYGDALGAFFFLVTAGGVPADGTLNTEGEPSPTFNTKWTSAARLTDQGYAIEMAIPWDSIPHGGRRGAVMSFKAARLISRIGEEADFPQIDPSRQPHLAQFQKIAVSGIAAGRPAATAVMDVMDRFRGKMEASRRHDTKTLMGRAIAWGDASVIDYLMFPSHPLRAAAKPFHFASRPDPVRVKSVFDGLTYLDGRRVGDLEDLLRRTLSASFIAIQDGAVVYEDYFNGYDRDSMCTSFSVAKSFASTLVGIAVDEGRIVSVNDPITKYLPELKSRDARFERITIKDLLSMRSGLRYVEDDDRYRDNVVTYMAPDLRQAALRQTEVMEAPGSRFLYNNYNPLLVGMILERTTGQSVSAYLQDRLWTPLGMEFDGSWSTDSETSGFEKMESGVNARAIDFAKLGQLFLEEGRWGDTSLISTRWVAEATQPEGKRVSPDGGYYGYFWWGIRRPGGKSDFFGLGNKGQFVYVCPQKKLVIVRNGIEYGMPASEWERLFYDFASRF